MGAWEPYFPTRLQLDQLSRSIASAVSRAVERAVDQALASLPSLPGNSGFAPGNFRLKAISNSMTKALVKSCVFVVCKTMFTIGESQAISHANRTANTRTPNCQSSQGKIKHQKILWSEERRLEIQRPKQQRWMEMVATNKRA